MVIKTGILTNFKLDESKAKIVRCCISTVKAEGCVCVYKDWGREKPLLSRMYIPWYTTLCTLDICQIGAQ